MTFLGVRPLVVAALIAVGLTVAVLLYLRQWGRRRVVVAFTPLWKRVMSEADVGTSRRRVLEILSLLLQAAVIALLAFALGRPLIGRQPEVRAIVIDTSASMLAITPPRGDRLSAAKQRALELLDRLSDEDRVALVTSGGEARLLFAPTSDHWAVRQKIASLEGCACEGRLREAIEITRGIVAKGAMIDVLTDGNEIVDFPDPPNVELFGAPTANVGITLLGVRPTPASPGRYEGLLELRSFAQGRARGQLRVSVDGALVDLRDWRLEPGERQTVTLPPLQSGSGSALLKAELFNIDIDGGLDALAEDNRAFALLAPEAERPIRLVAPPAQAGKRNGADFVRDVLRANPHYRIVDVDPDKANSEGGAGAITVVSGAKVPTTPGRYLVLGPPTTGKNDGEDGLVTEWSTDHPVLRRVALQGITVRGTPTKPPEGAQILARYGSVPLIYLSETSQRTELGTTFDVYDSNMPFRVAFPVFVYNAIDWLGGEEELDTQRTPGRRWRIERSASGPVKKLSIDGPSKNADVSLRGDAIVVDGADAAGLYRIEADDETFRIATSLTSAHESDLAVRSTTSQTSAPLGRAADLWSWLIFAAIGVLVLEWTLYHRRVTS